MRTLTLFLATLIAVAPAHAGTSVRIGIGLRPDREAHGHYRGHPRSHHHDRYDRHHRTVVSYPVYVPVAPPPPTYPGMTGNYASDLALFNEKLSRSRTIVQRQAAKESIPAESADRMLTLLDGIEHEARVRAFNNGGNLSGHNFADLHRRLDYVNEEIQIALAQ